MEADQGLRPPGIGWHLLNLLFPNPSREKVAAFTSPCSVTNSCCSWHMLYYFIFFFRTVNLTEIAKCRANSQLYSLGHPGQLNSWQFLQQRHSLLYPALLSAVASLLLAAEPSWKKPKHLIVHTFKTDKPFVAYRPVPWGVDLFTCPKPWKWVRWANSRPPCFWTEEYRLNAGISQYARFIWWIKLQTDTCLS